VSYKIGFAGTDGRTLLSALVTSTSTSEHYRNDFQGLVIRGMPAMKPFAGAMEWPVEFIPTSDNSKNGYAAAIIDAIKRKDIDCVMPMPEDLLLDGLVDELEAAGFSDHILGFTQKSAFIEGDKIACKHLCREYNIPVADQWDEVDARDYEMVLKTCLSLIDRFGGAVLKYPYSAGGKGSRIILNAWEIKEVYDTLIKDYGKSYKRLFGKKSTWPLLIESRMSGVEISLNILIDKSGNFQILPTSMDYPERFPGPASKDNPITGGMGSISPHPMETPALVEMAAEDIVKPLITALREKNMLRPCLVYPGCFLSFDDNMMPTRIRVCEINIRPPEPEWQPIVRRIRNLGALIQATAEGRLDDVQPEIRSNQISICTALVTGPGGPQNQKGYPWSCTKGEPVDIDFGYLKKKKIQVIPSAMTYSEEDQTFKSDGSRVVYCNVNAGVKPGQSRAKTAEQLRRKILAAFENGKIRVIPRENADGNRLDLRNDIGNHFDIAEELLRESKHAAGKTS
jgi:phosphoribosylamine---glycine ligase